MGNVARAHSLDLSPAALRPLAGTEITVVSGHGTVRGTVLSCTARSLWLVANDADVVVPLDGIVSLHR